MTPLLSLQVSKEIRHCLALSHNLCPSCQHMAENIMQDRMHLDCVFSILGDDVCLMLEEMMGENSPTRRLVDEYTRDSSGTYSLSRENVEFSQYMRENGYHIIPIKPEHQLVQNFHFHCPTPRSQCPTSLLPLATAV